MVTSIGAVDECDQGKLGISKESVWIEEHFNRLRQPQKNEVWYLIDSDWWRTHVVRGHPFRTLDNTRLIDPITNSLKLGLTEGISNDFVIVDLDLWNRITSICETTSRSKIARTVIEDIHGNTRVETYPLIFQVCVCDQDGNLRRRISDSTGNDQPVWNFMHFGCKDNMGYISDLVFNELGIPKGSPCRWWRKPLEGAETDPFELINMNDDIGNNGLESTILEHINVVMRDYILVEPMNANDTWPRDLPHQCQVGGTISTFSDGEWRNAQVINVDYAEKSLLLRLPDSDDLEWFAYDDERMRTPPPTPEMHPVSPDSSSSSGSIFRSKRSLEGDIKMSNGGSHAPASRSRMGPGIKGLQNLGNTCFMASTLQCLNRTIPFTQYFLSKGYVHDLNYENKMGMKGQLAMEYAKLLVEIWVSSSERHNGTGGSFAPFDIKRVIATHAPMFSGFRQHDSQELLAFLLDGLHEDLNRVTNKPYTPAVESEGRDDETVAAEAWGMHLARNQSIVVDLFQGQLKSTVVCPKCERVSITFDPMMYLSLPLTAFNVRTITVSIVFSDFSKPSIVKTFKVQKNGTILTLCNVIAQFIHSRPDRIMIYEIYSGNLHKAYFNSEKLSSINAGDLIFAYEMPIDQSTESVPNPIWVKHIRPCNNRSISASYASNATIMYPYPLFVQHPITHAQLHAIVLKLISSMLIRSGKSISADDFLIKIVPRSGYVQNQQSLTESDLTEWQATANVKCDLYVHWNADAFITINNAASDMTARTGSRTANSTPDITLQDCVKLFTAEEELSQEDPWYCSSCKAFQQASKKFDLWKLPKILIVHLKRFQYTTYTRNKLDLMVDYPIEGLDLTTFVKGPQRDSPVIYDLYAISNHYGGFGGGHYTAYGKCSDDKGWYSFDDSITRPSSVGEIKSRAAYVLFYQLRESSQPASS